MSVKKLVKEELSGSNAKLYVGQVARFHRIQGSPMFHEAAEYVKSELLKIGLDDVAIEQFPADGKTMYWTYTSPVGWEVKSAELRLVEPEERLLCTYEETPQSLHTFSKGTPKQGVMAELIDVDAGIKTRNYEGRNVKGKLVLASGRAKRVHELAVLRYGAVGVLTDSPIEMSKVREGIDIPDAHAYQGIWPTAKELPKIRFGFSVSKRQGNSLRAMLKIGKRVRLKATVEARFFPFYEDVVTATLKGATKPEEEILLVAHLCHPKPSANDNASGAGLLLEIARAVKSLINSRKLPRPNRTIRFLWVPETLGSVAYIARHEDVADRIVAGIDLDMVGQNQELCRSTLNVDRTPDSLPSYLNDFVFNLVEQSVDEFDAKTHFGSGSTLRYRMNTFSGGSDHAEFSNSTTHVPCLMLLQWPDLFYHTSMDTIDKVSEDMLKRVGWITTVATLTLASANHEVILQMANLTASRGISRIAETGNEAITKVIQVTKPKAKGKQKPKAGELARTAGYFRTKIEHVVWRETEAVKSVRRLGVHPELTTYVDACCNDLVRQGKRETAKLESTVEFAAKLSATRTPTAPPPETKTEKELKRLVPKRTFKGTLCIDVLEEGLGDAEFDWYREIDEKDEDFGKKMAEAVNFMDGKRSGYDILKAVSSEYTPTDPDYMLKFLRDLQKTKLIAIR